MMLRACQAQPFGEERAVERSRRWEMATFTSEDNAKEK